MFIFQQSQITQDEFDKLAKQLIKFLTVYAKSKFDVEKNQFITTTSIKT